MFGFFSRVALAVAGLQCLWVALAVAQHADSTARSRFLDSASHSPGHIAGDGLRLEHLLKGTSTAGFLIRSPSTLLAQPDSSATGEWVLIAPELRIAWNSDLPFSLNDGPMWSGRGLSTQLTAGARATLGPVSIVLAPQVLYLQNRRFSILENPGLDRSAFARSWHVGPHSIDLPLRFGDEPYHVIDPGQSSLAVRAGPVQLGAATENQWWGPGIRNAIVLSNNAPGFPHLFVRTSEPVMSPIGRFEAKWLAGGLTESLFFDTIRGNDHRFISGFAGTFTPAGEPGLTLGLARAVYGAADGAGSVPGHALEVFTFGAGGVLAPDDSSASTEPEQITSVFGRWVFPQDGFEVYAEWARTELPRGLRELLERPHQSQGYTLGLQWARRVLDEAAIRFQAEVTNLEQTPPSPRGPFFYVSERIPQGYTHRGQVIGASIGPGASSQWLALDYIAPAWGVGLFGGRVRWDNDAFYTTIFRHSGLAHDVSLFGGVRLQSDLGPMRLAAEFILSNRMNYLYQNYHYLYYDGISRPVDIRNHTFRLSITP